MEMKKLGISSVDNEIFISQAFKEFKIRHELWDAICIGLIL